MLFAVGCVRQGRGGGHETGRPKHTVPQHALQRVYAELLVQTLDGVEVNIAVFKHAHRRRGDLHVIYLRAWLEFKLKESVPK